MSKNMLKFTLAVAALATNAAFALTPECEQAISDAATADSRADQALGAFGDNLADVSSTGMDLDLCRNTEDDCSELEQKLSDLQGATDGLRQAADDAAREATEAHKAQETAC